MSPKVSVNSLRGRLYLLSRFPRKDGTPGLQQARIPLGLPDTAADRKVAEKRRARVQREVDQGTFSWSDWLEPTAGVTWRQAIDQLYRKRVVNGRTGQSTWEINYMGRLRQLPMTQPVTAKSIVAAMQKYDRDQCSYKELYYLLKDLCQLVAVPFPEMPVPTYTTSKVTDVPDDDQIEEWVRKSEERFAWHLGMMATYGLRPHEIKTCSFVDEKHRLHVSDQTKTGERIVIPLHAHWVDLFDLRNEKPYDKGIAQWMHAERKKIGMTCKPYALRHAYVGRLWRLGGSHLDIFTAARMLGHSVKEHEKTYRAWIAPHTIAQKAELALQANLQSLQALSLQQLDCSRNTPC